MNFTHNLWSAGAAGLMSSLAVFLPVPSSATIRTTPPEGHMQSVPADIAPPSSISGTVVDHDTNQPVSGAIVVIEQLGAISCVLGQNPPCPMVDRVVATTTSGPDGSFVFTGLQAGNVYDVVADASVTLPSGVTQTYEATITTMVPVGAVLGQVPLVSSGPVPAVATDKVTTATSSGTGTGADIKLSALLGFPIKFTIPPFAGSTPQVTTAAGANCPNGADCASYTLSVPANGAVSGMFNPGGTFYNIPPSNAPHEVVYVIEGRAFLPGTATPDCTPTRQTVSFVANGTLAQGPLTLNFTGCQAAAGGSGGFGTISGILVDHSTNLPVSGANVALEQANVAPACVPCPVTANVVATTTSGPDGSFIFTGLLPGNLYDVVADASVTLASGATQTYTATITTGIPTGATLGLVPLVPEFGPSAPSGAPAEISAEVSASTSGGTATSAEVKISAVQESSFQVQFPIPPFAGSTPDVTTSPGGSSTYTLFVPNGDPVLGFFQPGGTNYMIPSDSQAQGEEVIYAIQGSAFLPGTNVSDCNPSFITKAPVLLRGPLTIATVIPNLDFTSCQ